MPQVAMPESATGNQNRSPSPRHDHRSHSHGKHRHHHKKESRKPSRSRSRSNERHSHKKSRKTSPSRNNKHHHHHSRDHHSHHGLSEYGKSFQGSSVAHAYPHLAAGEIFDPEHFRRTSLRDSTNYAVEDDRKMPAKEQRDGEYAPV